jgi:hypothetical protein
MAKGTNSSGEYWPGFVDALTNVVIAMIFVTVVLAIALSFSAQLASKRMAVEMVRQLRAADAAAAAPSRPGSAPTDQADYPGSPTAGTVTTRIPVKGEKQAPGGGAVFERASKLILDFSDTAVTLDEEARERLKKALAAEPERLRNGRIQLVAQGPSMQLSENQRASYLRIMAVRNLLIEQGTSPEAIALKIDTEREARAPVVSISFGPREQP